MTLPKVLRSGVTSSSSCPPPRATRKPVMTSSKISSAPTRSHSARRPLRKPVVGGDEAHVGGDRLDDHAGGAARRARARRCTGATTVSATAASVTPAEPGQAERGQPGAGLGQQQVAMAVVVARRTSRPCAGPCGRGPPARRTSWPRCPTTRGGPARPTAPARRSPRPAAPRARSARRRTCRRRRRAARPRRWRGGRGRR